MIHEQRDAPAQSFGKSLNDPAERSVSASPVSRLPKLNRDELLHEILESRARAFARGIALVFANTSITYGELNAKANQVAHHLRALGVGAGSFVAIELPRSIDLYIGILAILKAGAAYVPLDTSWAPERISYILSDLQVHTLVTTSELLSKLGKISCRSLRIDKSWMVIDMLPTCDIPRSVTRTRPDGVCCVLYTSETIGKPKGIVVEHRSACHLVRAEGFFFGANPEDCVYHGSSIASDTAMQELWLGFFAGAKICVDNAEKATTGSSLTCLLAAARVTVLSTQPTVLASVDDDLADVRMIILRGESSSQQEIHSWARPNRRLVKTYGHAEVSGTIAFADVGSVKSNSIGEILPNFVVHLLGSANQFVEPGEVGEICVGGIGLSRGYVGKAELTHTRFIANPCASLAGQPAKLFRTGDLGRLNEAGEIELIGQAQGVGDCCFELGEPECATTPRSGGHPIASCGLEDVSRAKPFVRDFFAQCPGHDLDKDAHALVRGSTTAHAFPWVVVGSSPLTGNEQVDRPAVPAPKRREGGAKGMWNAWQGQVKAAVSAVKHACSTSTRALRDSEVYSLPIRANDGLFDEYGEQEDLIAIRVIPPAQRATNTSHLHVPSIPLRNPMLLSSEDILGDALPLAAHDHVELRESELDEHLAELADTVARLVAYVEAHIDEALTGDLDAPAKRKIRGVRLVRGRLLRSLIACEELMGCPADSQQRDSGTLPVSSAEPFPKMTARAGS